MLIAKIAKAYESWNVKKGHSMPRRSVVSSGWAEENQNNSTSTVGAVHVEANLQEQLTDHICILENENVVKIPGV